MSYVAWLLPWHDGMSCCIILDQKSFDQRLECHHTFYVMRTLVQYYCVLYDTCTCLTFLSLGSVESASGDMALMKNYYGSPERSEF